MDVQKKLLSAEEIIDRASGIGLPLTKLAADAGLSPSTPYRWKSKGGSATQRQLRRMQQALLIREQHLLAHLRQIYDADNAEAEE